MTILLWQDQDQDEVIRDRLDHPVSLIMPRNMLAAKISRITAMTLSA